MLHGAQTSGLSLPHGGCRILRFSDLKATFNHPWSRMHTDREEKAGRFPKRIQIGPNSVGWLEPEYIAWQAERIAARNRITEPQAA